MKKSIIYAVSTFIAMIILLGCNVGAKTVTGTISVYDGNGVYTQGDACSTVGSSYEDVGVGTDVVVNNSDGAIVGVGKLEAGIAEGQYRCRFRFTLEVKDGEVYTFAFGDRRVGLIYSRAEMEEKGWSVYFSIGGYYDE